MEYRTENDMGLVIAEAIMSQKTEVVLPEGTQAEDVRKVIRIFMCSHPEVFWFSHQYYFDNSLSKLFLKYDFNRQKKDFFSKEIDNAVESLFQPGRLNHLSEMEKTAYVYKWIASNTTYNEYSSFNQTVYSVLINRNSACTGYAKTAQYLLGLLGVESTLVFGKFHSDISVEDRHVWNIVKINNEWYHVDFCMADPILKHLLNSDESPIEHDGLLWNYFCKPTAYVLRNRSIEYPECYPVCGKSIDLKITVSLVTPFRQLAVCKSDSGTSSRVYLDSFDKNSVIKTARNVQSLMHNECRIMRSLQGCRHIVQMINQTDEGIVLEQLIPWPELLNSHYYHPDEQQLRNILIQLVTGLVECRNNGICYSDIHYNNVFVSKDGTYKWGDFGIAYYTNADGSIPRQLIGADGIPFGSRWFMAPETFHDRVFTESSAVYALAVLAYFVMNDMRPPLWNAGVSEQDILDYRLSGCFIDSPVNVHNFELLSEQICDILNADVRDRVKTFEEFIELLVTERAFDDAPLISHGNSFIIDSNNDCCISAPNDFDCGSENRDSYAMSALEYACPVDLDNSYSVDSCPAGASPTDYRATDSFAGTRGLGAKESPSMDVAGSPDFNPYCKSSSSDISDNDSYAATVIREQRESYRPVCSKPSLFKRIFGKKSKGELINASAYAPAEIIPEKDYIVRVFIHKPEESVIIDSLVESIDSDAVKKANKTLDVPVKEGDRITVILSMTDGVCIDEPVQSYIWRGRHIDFDFIFKLNLSGLYSVYGKAIIAVNNIPRGELKFTIDVIRYGNNSHYAKVDTRRYSRIFISYAHADYIQVRGIAEGCKINGSDYFFDRHTLKAGDLFKEKILQYIDNADLFVLCWSKNAAESKWVEIERKHAIELIEGGKSQLALYPLSMPPEAPLPEDMSEKYNFVSL